MIYDFTLPQGPVSALHDFGSVLGRPLDTFFWALTISRSRLLARVRSGPAHVEGRERLSSKLQCRQLGIALNGFHVPK